MREVLRIGEIRYSNCTPIYQTLKGRFDCSRYEFVPGDPAELNALLARGEIDVSSSSSIEYARHWREYLVIPGVSVSSNGKVGSILLFSKRPIEGLGGEKVAVSKASATSVVLLKALFKARCGIQANLVPRRPELSCMLDGCEAALLIGDEALRERKAPGDARGLHVYDLGQMWRELTGLPFVFALWMVREDSAARLKGLVRGFARDLIAAKFLAARSYRKIAEEAPEVSWMGVHGLVSYWNLMSYDLGGEHLMGLKEFFGMAHGLGEAGERPEIRFLPGVIY